ncbi:MAG: putative secretion system protein GspD-like [Proteobacteria bacterium]|nr:putative secretion system protein GspD-like [Pseudomonadota bacterium]
MKNKPLLTLFSLPAGSYLRFGLLVATAFFLSGCAGMIAHYQSNTLFSAGKVDEGMAKLEEAVREEPRNAEYRIALNTRKSEQVNRYVNEGENARQSGKLTEAEKAYRQVLKYDPNHVLAKQGLEAVAIDRRHRQAVGEAEALFKQNTPAGIADALEKLRPILSENPSQKEALNLKARIGEARSKDAKPEAKLAAVFRKTISLEFRDAPMKSVFDFIAKFAGMNFYFDKDLRPDLKASVLAKNTTVEDAVRLMLTTNQLEFIVLNDNSILIYPNTPQKQQEYQALSVRAFHLANSDVKAVSNSIKTIVKTKDMVIDERLGLIIIRDTPEAIRMAERIVSLQDMSDPEVMLDVEIMEIKRSRLLELGIQWPSQLALSPLQIGGVPITLEDLRKQTSATTQATIGSTLINARREGQDGNILANPRIRVRNKDKAKIMIGDRVPVITTTSTSTGFVAESVSYVDVGLKLEVEPNIYLDEEVGIKVNLDVSNIVREVLSKSGTLSYQIGTRNASTSLRLKNGETQILAGLISDEDRSTANKVPGLGELPIVGRLFGSQKDDGARSEILLSITPRVVRSIRRPDLQVAEFESGTSSKVGAPTLRLSNNETAKDNKPAAANTPAAQSAPVAGQNPATPVATAAPVGQQPAPSLAGQAATPQARVPAPASNTVAPPAAATPSTGAVVTPVSAANVQPVGATKTIAADGKITLSWQTPSQVKTGEQFTSVLKLTSQPSLRGLPILVAFDPQTLQVVSVQEGDFFKQGSGKTNFTHRIDTTQGKIFAAVVRQSAGGADAGINGSGGVLSITFKAIKAGSSSRLQVLSATPEPAPATPLAVPVEQVIKITP